MKDKASNRFLVVAGYKLYKNFLKNLKAATIEQKEKIFSPIFEDFFSDLLKHNEMFKDIIDTAKSGTWETAVIAWGIAKIVFAGFFGGVSAYALIIPGFALANSY